VRVLRTLCNCCPPLNHLPFACAQQVPHPWARAWDLSVPEIVAATLNMLLPSVHHACAGDQHDSPAPQLSGSSATVQHPATVPLLDNMINPRMHLQAAHRVLRTVLARYTSWRERLCAFLIQVGSLRASMPMHIAEKYVLCELAQGRSAPSSSP